MHVKPFAISTLALSLCFSSLVLAQSSGGVAGISGIVRDPSGSAVPNAKVVISSQGKGVARSLVTNDAGAFAAQALIPGSGYKVTVTASGFNTYIADNLVLEVGQIPGSQHYSGSRHQHNAGGGDGHSQHGG